MARGGLVPVPGAGGALPDPDAFVWNTFVIGFQIAQEISKNVPVLQDEAVVEVTGQPGADKQQLYFLALATANGLVRKQALLQINPFMPSAYGSLMIEYDAAANWVRCTLGYRTGMLAAGQNTSLNSIFSIASTIIGAGLGAISELITGTLASKTTLIRNLVVYGGPQCDTVGSKFNFTDPILPGIPFPDSMKFPATPKLPFAGRVILSDCPSVPEPVPDFTNPTPRVPNNLIDPKLPNVPTPNPKPPGDNRSRGVIFGPGVVNNSNPPILGTLPPDTGPTSPSESGMTGSSSGVPVTQTGVSYPTPCCPKSPLLIPLVFAALTDPGGLSLETFTPPVQGPVGG